MSTVHSYAVGNGDMFSIRHNTDNCTIIDCNISDDNKDWLLKEIDNHRKNKTITRFISTHPDQDHLTGLEMLDEHIEILNFYVVKNKATKKDETQDFKHYKKLRDGDKAFYIFEGCGRKWMNQEDKERGSAGINIHWPILSNEHFKKALEDARDGKNANNISPVITYYAHNSARMAWFGDLETSFMENIKDAIQWPVVDVLFAPHHGRDSGRIPQSILEQMDPEIVVVGEAPSKDLNYYSGYNTITQNSAGSIAFECTENLVHIYVESSTYDVDFLEEMFLGDMETGTCSSYIGSLVV